MSFINDFTTSQINFWVSFYLRVFGIRIKVPIIRKNLDPNVTHSFSGYQLTLEILQKKFEELFSYQMIGPDLFAGGVRDMNRPTRIENYVFSTSGLGVYDESITLTPCLSENQVIGPGFVGITFRERLLLEIQELYRRTNGTMEGEESQKYLDPKTKTVCLGTIYISDSFPTQRHPTVCYAEAGIVIGSIPRESVFEKDNTPEDGFRFPRVVEIIKV